MMRHSSSLLALMLAAGLALGTATGPAMAETRAQGSSPYAPAILVNGLGITAYEIDQRSRFMQLLGAKGDVRKQAEDALIDDRLQMWKANSLGIAVSKNDLTQGMSEFASRANLSTDDFIKALAQAGVEAQTYRDFVAAGVVWRSVVKATYGGGRVRISDADVDRALALETPQPAQQQVLLSEIVIRARQGREAEAMAKARKAAAARTEADFAAIAREVSSSPTASKGGRLDWMPVEALPPEVRQKVMNMKPGQNSGPVETPNSVSVFFMRGLDEGGKVAPQAQAVGYATLLLGASGAPETAALTRKAEAEAKRCDDLYSVARGLPPERVQQVDGARAGSVPADIAQTLPRLDVGETRVLKRGGNDLLVMLCDRGRAMNATLGETAPSKEGTRNQLANARVGTLAGQLLAKLRADAVIVRK
jgi:peptidyl-prolyl cis-trans isomerase SurA